MNGIVVVDKPPLLTSHDVVDFIRTKFKIKKVGHAGTLDPMATGVLIILLGAFTKKSIEFTNTDKEYIGTMILGIETDSGDSQGKIISEKETADLNEEKIRSVEVIEESKKRVEKFNPIASEIGHEF